ncbi:MAG: hydroxyphenylacetyl-CoA thioesterase PaaI [Pikeienuella sp.]
MTETTAERAAAILWAEDHCAKWLGVKIDAVSEGAATLSLVVEKHHCNGHGILHGGVTFALADTAFAYACNSRGQKTVAQSNNITYLAPGQVGDTITATAREVQLKGRSGIYDITVATHSGTVIAEFRGQSRAIPGSLFEETT